MEVQLDKDRTKVKTALEDPRRVLDSHSKRLLNETTTDFEKRKELIRRSSPREKKVNGAPDMKALADEVDGIMEIARELRLDHCIELFEAAGLLERLLGASKKLAEKLSAPVC